MHTICLTSTQCEYLERVVGTARRKAHRDSITAHRLQKEYHFDTSELVSVIETQAAMLSDIEKQVTF